MLKESESHSVVSNFLQPQGLYSPRSSLGQNTGVGSLSLLQEISPIQGLNPGPPHYRLILYQLSQKGSPRILEWLANAFSSGSSWPKNWTRVSCIADRFLTNWVIREAPDLLNLHNCMSQFFKINLSLYIYILLVLFLWRALLIEKSLQLQGEKETVFTGFSGCWSQSNWMACYLALFCAQLCPTLGHPMDCSLPGPSVHGILQARIQEWVAISSSRGSSQARDWTRVSCIGRHILHCWVIRDALLPRGLF